MGSLLTRCKRPKGIKSRKRDELESRKEDKVVGTLSDIRDELRRSTDVMKTVADGQAEGRRFDKDCTLLQILPLESEEYKRVLSRVMGTRDGDS